MTLGLSNLAARSAWTGCSAGSTVVSESLISLAYRLTKERDTPIALGLAAHGATTVMLDAEV